MIVRQVTAPKRGLSAQGSAEGRAPTSGLEAIAKSRAVHELEELAYTYAQEIPRSPFVAPISDWSALSLMAVDDAWYPSQLLTDKKLKQRPKVPFSDGLLYGMYGGREGRKWRERIEAQHRAALARAFVTARDRHPAYKRLLALKDFRLVLTSFGAARDKSNLKSPLRAPQADAQLIVCIAQPLFRLAAKDWRVAPTRRKASEAKKAAKALLAGAKDGLHAIPGYWRVHAALQAFLRELDTAATTPRAPKLSEYTAPNATLTGFETQLKIYFGTETWNDLAKVRQGYAAMLGFRNVRDKVSP